MSFKRVTWLALLLPQFALLLLFIYDDLRELRHEQVLHDVRAMGCIGLPPFDALEFSFAVLGLVGIIALCGFRRWARYCYLLFTVALVMTMRHDLANPFSEAWSEWLALSIVGLTLFLCFGSRAGLFSKEKPTVAS